MSSGMVVTPHPLATDAGVEALRAGGTAVDAAVAANAMLAVVYCNACGLGGDAFALVWDPGEGRLFGYNGSGRAPGGLTIEAVRAAGHATMPDRGPLTINVPGAVDAWSALLDRFGRGSLADCTRSRGTRRRARLRADGDQRPLDRREPAVLRRDGDGRVRVGGRGRHDVPPTAPGRHAPPAVRRRAGRLLRRRARRGDRSSGRRSGRRPYQRGPRRASRRLGRPDLHSLPRRRGRDHAAQLAGHHRAHGPQRPRGTRLAGRAAAARADRGDARSPGASATDASPIPTAGWRTYRSSCRTSTRAGWRRGCRRTRRIGSLRRTRPAAARCTCAQPMRTG